MIHLIAFPRVRWSCSVVNFGHVITGSRLGEIITSVSVQGWGLIVNGLFWMWLKDVENANTQTLN